MASGWGDDIASSAKAARAKQEDSLFDVFKRSIVARTGDELAKQTLAPVSGAISSGAKALFVTPFERRAAEKFMNPDRRKFNNDLTRQDDEYASWIKHEKAGIEKGHSREFIAFEKDFTEEKRMEYIQELNNQGKLSSLKIEGMEGLGFSIKDLDADVFKNMVYQSLDESKDANGKSYLTLLADKFDNMKNTYEESIPTGRTRQLSFKGMDSPKNLGQFITSKIKNIFDKGDNDERLFRAIDNIATNDEDLMKDKRFARIVQTKRALENIDSTFAADAKALLNLEQKEIFQENLLIKKFNELGATGTAVTSIESDDSGLYEQTIYTYETAAGKKSHEVRKPLSDKADPDGRLLASNFQGKSSTQAFAVAMKNLTSDGMTQLKAIIDDKKFVDGDGKPLTLTSRNITAPQYDFMISSMEYLAITNEGQYRSKAPEIEAAKMSAISSLVGKMTKELKDATAPYEVYNKDINDSMFFVDPKERLTLKPLKEIITNTAQRKAFVVNSKRPSQMTQEEFNILKRHQGQEKTKLAAQKRLRESVAGVNQFFNREKTAEQFLRDQGLPEDIRATDPFAPKVNAKEKTPSESLLKDILAPTNTRTSTADRLFSSNSLFTKP
jgi:hypothetical protein